MEKLLSIGLLMVVVFFSCKKNNPTLSSINSENRVQDNVLEFNSNKNFEGCDSLDLMKLKINVKHKKIRKINTSKLVVKINYRIFYDGEFEHDIDVLIPKCERNLFYFEFFLVEDENIYKWTNKDTYSFKSNDELEIALRSYSQFNKDIAKEFDLRVK